MSMPETIRTVLDAPVAPIQGCHYCNPEVNENGLCDPCFATINARVETLLAMPAVVAILERAERLTGAELLLLAAASVKNFRDNRLPRLRLHHRVVKAYGPNWRDLGDADGRIFRRFETAVGPHSFALHAINDAAFAAMVGDLLDPDEARLFTKPWMDVVSGAAR